jgi:hypothetical protein
LLSKSTLLYTLAMHLKLTFFQGRKGRGYCIGRLLEIICECLWIEGLIGLASGLRKCFGRCSILRKCSLLVL